MWLHSSCLGHSITIKETNRPERRWRQTKGKKRGIGHGTPPARHGNNTNLSVTRSLGSEEQMQPGKLVLARVHSQLWMAT